MWLKARLGIFWSQWLTGIASATLFEFPQISAVRVEVKKPHVAVQGIIDYLGVEIVRHRKDMAGSSPGAE